MDLRDFNAPLRYGATIAGDISFTNSGGTMYITGGNPFVATAAFGTATTGSTILADSSVTLSRQVYITGFNIKSVGNTWFAGSGTSVILQDSAGTPLFHVFAEAINTTGGVGISSGSAVSTYTWYSGGAGTAGKGLSIKVSTGTLGGNGTAYITVWGLIK